MNHGAADLGRRGKGAGRQGQDNLCVSSPLRQNCKASVGFAAGLCNDALGNFALEHQCQALPERRPVFGCQPAHQKLGADIVGQVRRDADRRGEMRQRIDLERVAIDYF